MNKLAGKKTYGAATLVAGAIIAGYASRHGVDLDAFGVSGADIAAAVGALGVGLVVWARKVAQPAPVVVTDTRASKTSGPNFS